MSFSFDVEGFLGAARHELGQHNPVPAREPRPRRCPRGPAYDLMPDSIRAKLPTEDQALNQGLDAIVHVKYFLPGTGLTWYVVGYDPDDDILYNFQCGAAHLDDEMGTVFLHELEQLCAGGMFYVERDLYFTPITLREARETRP
jgi:hypothetical protein